MMNRHERRRTRKARENKFYTGYVKHLLRVPLDTPLERGRVYHTVLMHDDWCAHYDCNPIVTRHVEPKRS